MLQIESSPSTLRVDLFKTREREHTKGIFVGYLNTPPDPRICVEVMDEYDCCHGNFGVRHHFIVKTDGTVQVGRDIRTVAAHSRTQFDRWEQVAIGVVGGRNPDTYTVEDTLTDAQAAAIEELLQYCADTLGVPLEVHDKVTDRIVPEEVRKGGWQAAEAWREERRLQREREEQQALLEDEEQEDVDGI
jgi:hypothetical protein